MKIFFAFILSLTISLANGTDSDFTKICKIYTDAYQQESFKKLGPDKQASYIHQKIGELVKPGDALEAYQAVAQADPTKKYKPFKQAAEMSAGKPWDCPAINNIDLSY